MKKLINSLDHVDPFIAKLEKKKMKEFFDRVKNISPYYKHEEWEGDYERQVLFPLSLIPLLFFLLFFISLILFCHPIHSNSNLFNSFMDKNL